LSCLLLPRRTPRSTRFPYTTLFRSGRRSHQFLSSRINSEACYNTTGIQGSVSQCPGGVSSSTATGSGEDCTASNIYGCGHGTHVDRKSTRLNSSHVKISYAVFCLKK